MRICLAVLLCLPLGGCLFFYIPSSLFQSGNACTGEGAYVGQKLKHDDGRTGEIKEVIGRHQRCQQANRPMLVQVEYP